MVLTPVFDVQQDEDFVFIRLKVPYLKVARHQLPTEPPEGSQTSSMDFEIGGRDFKFCAAPYFLRLTLPHQVVENGQQKATYDIEKGELTVYVPKATKGQHFENLDMQTTLLGEASPDQKTPLVQPVEQQGGPNPPPLGSEQQYEYEGKLLDRMIAGEHVPMSEIDSRAQPAINNLVPTHPYGFNNKFMNYLSSTVESLPDLVEIPDPDHTDAAARRAARIIAEDQKFDEEHYMSDFIMDEEIKGILAYKPHWVQELAAAESLWSQKKAANQPTADVTAQVIVFTVEEKDVLTLLQNKSYILEDERVTLMGLLDILFAYAYDTRSSLGEHTVESWWNAFADFAQQFNDPSTVLLASIRRSLAYPLYRHWGLVEAVLQDVKWILGLGKRAVVRSLIATKQLFDKADTRRHLAILYINDYLTWAQTLSDEKIASLNLEVRPLKFSKEQIGWGLAQLEQEAEASRGEEQQLMS